MFRETIKLKSIVASVEFLIGQEKSPSDKQTQYKTCYVLHLEEDFGWIRNVDIKKGDS